MAEAPRIQFLSFEGCPNASPLRTAVADALAARGLGAIAIEDVDVEANDCPPALRHWPSPTILVNGEDLFGDKTADGAACRIYGPGGLPEAEVLETRLNAALIAGEQRATTDLHFTAPGSLPRPGPVGRLVRLVFGLTCFYIIVDLIGHRGEYATDPGAFLGNYISHMVFGLFLVSYVVNIGFARDWRKLPVVAVLFLAVGASAVGYVLFGDVVAPPLALLSLTFGLYLYAHLGLSFLLAGVFATPGCEMRSIAHLHGKITGRHVDEHHCPVGPLQPLDRWEAGQSWRR